MDIISIVGSGALYLPVAIRSFFSRGLVPPCQLLPSVVDQKECLRDYIIHLSPNSSELLDQDTCLKTLATRTLEKLKLNTSESALESMKELYLLHRRWSLIELNLLVEFPDEERQFSEAHEQQNKLYHDLKSVVSKPDLNVPDSEGFTPLTRAVANINKTWIRFLYSIGAKLETSDAHGFTPVTYAIDKGYTLTLQTLLALKPNLNISDANGFTPLTLAIARGNLNHVEILLSQGADPHVADARGITALAQAESGGHTAILRLLVSLEEQKNLPPEAIEINQELETYLTSHDQDALKRFLSKSQSMNNLDLVKAVLHAHPEFNINDEVGHGYSLLDWAVRDNDEAMVRFLHSLGANLNVSYGGTTPLTYAIAIGNEIMVRLLVSLGADIHVWTKTTLTALTMAKLIGNKPMIEFLTECGGDTHEADLLYHIKMVGHIFSLDGESAYTDRYGRTQSIPLEGLPSDAALQLFAPSACSFLRKSPSSLSQPLRDEICQTIELAKESANWLKNQSFSSEALLSRIQSGQSVFLPISLVEPHHTISVVFGNDRLYVCDRGHVTHSHPIEVYTLPASSVTKELLEKLRSPTVSDRDFQELLKDSPEITKSPEEERITVAWQKVGNCTWANMKVALLALLDIAMAKQIPNIEERHEFCHELYKQYTTDLRIQQAYTYLTQPIDDLSPELLGNLRRKIGNNWHIETEAKEDLIAKIDETVLEKEYSLCQSACYPPKPLPT